MYIGQQDPNIFSNVCKLGNQKFKGIDGVVVTLFYSCDMSPDGCSIQTKVVLPRHKVFWKK